MAKQVNLSHEEMMGLITEAQKGNDSAMERIVEGNTRLIWKITQRFMNRGHDLEDLFQIGAIGFMKAVKKFNMEYNVKFSTYAVPMIIGEIQRFFRDDGAVRVPRSIKDLAKKMRALEIHTKDPEVYLKALIEKGVETTLDKVKVAQEYMKSRVMSTDETVYAGANGDEEITLGEQLDSDMNGNWAENMELREALDQLEPKERKIMELRYFKDLTQTEVADKLKVSQVQVSRLEKKILAKMKELLEAKTEKEPVMEEKPMSNANFTQEQREEAIKLLKETSLTLKEISEKTTVGIPTLSTWGRKFRDPEVTKEIKRRTAVRTAKARKKVKPVETPVIDLPAFKGDKDLEREAKKTAALTKVVTESESRRLAHLSEAAEAVNKSMEQTFSAAGTTTGRFKSNEPNVSQVPKKAEPQTVTVDKDEIVVLNHKGEDVFRVKDNTTVLKVDKPITIKSAIHFDVSVKFGGESVTKDQAVESLYEAYNLVKKLPTDTLSVTIIVNN